MEDSIELSNSGKKSLNIMISPENVKLSKFKFINNTGSQQSLAYSNSTLQKDIITQRSSPRISLPNFNQQNPHLQSQTRIKKPQKNEEQNIFSKKSSTMKLNQADNYHPSNLKQPWNIKQRKTVDKNQVIRLSRKNKQLEYALQLETIVSQELRAKVTVLSEMMEHKIKDLGLGELLKLKNTSKDMKNIDIFIQMKSMKKIINQKDVTIERQKLQIKQLNSELDYLKSNQKSLENHHGSRNNTNQEIKELRQQKESLFNYIEELKEQFQRKNQYCKNLQLQIERLINKQNHFTEVDRPKLFDEIEEKSKKNRILQQQIIELKMSFNLMEFTSKENINNLNKEIQVLKSQISKGNQQNNKIQNKKKFQINQQTQTTMLPQNQILKAQLSLLKTERDHYRTEYRKKIQQSSELYELKLKQRLQNKYN